MRSSISTTFQAVRFSKGAAFARKRSQLPGSSSLLPAPANWSRLNQSNPDSVASIQNALLQNDAQFINDSKIVFQAVDVSVDSSTRVRGITIPVSITAPAGIQVTALLKKWRRSNDQDRGSAPQD